MNKCNTNCRCPTVWPRMEAFIVCPPFPPNHSGRTDSQRILATLTFTLEVWVGVCVYTHAKARVCVQFFSFSFPYGTQEEERDDECSYFWPNRFFSQWQFSKVKHSSVLGSLTKITFLVGERWGRVAPS